MSVSDVKAEPCPFCGKGTTLEHIRYDNCFVVRCLHCGYVSAHTASERGAIENHNKICRLLPKPDPDWKDICAKCRDGEIEPDCEYYGEPNGCNSPIYGEHPKSAPVGNSAALRGALELCVKEMCARCREAADALTSSIPCINGCETLRIAKEALALPRRNCDVGTAEEQYERHKKLCSRACLSCPVHKEFDFRKALSWSCQLVWAQMPYEEGGAK